MGKAVYLILLFSERISYKQWHVDEDPLVLKQKEGLHS